MTSSKGSYDTEINIWQLCIAYDIDIDVNVFNNELVKLIIGFSKDNYSKQIKDHRFRSKYSRKEANDIVYLFKIGQI